MGTASSAAQDKLLSYGGVYSLDEKDEHVKSLVAKGYLVEDREAEQIKEKLQEFKSQNKKTK